MRIKQIKLYKFEELSDKAKEKARDWFRQGYDNEDWHEYIYEDAKRMFSFCGFTIKDIYFSGFSSQGDGACFEGSWYARDVKPGELQKEAPKDEKLHAIAAEAERLAKSGASFTVKQSGHYSHEYCTAFDFDIPEEIKEEDINQLEEDLTEMARDAMRWIYRQLETEYFDMMGDERVDDNITANEYEFTEDGKMG